MVATIECIDRSRARDSWAISAPSPTIGRSVSTESSSSSSSTPDDARAGAAQHPAAYDVVRRGRGGLVEHGGRRCPPVDQQRVAVGVAQADPADVARLRVHLVAHVEAAEDQPLVRGVQLRDPARGLEDHRVPLDEAALVAQPAAVVALVGQPLRSLGRDAPAAGRPCPRTPVRCAISRELVTQSATTSGAVPCPAHCPRAEPSSLTRRVAKAGLLATCGGTGTRSSPRAPRRRRTGVALSAASSSPRSSMRATRSRLRIRFDSRRPWAAPVASDSQVRRTSASSSSAGTAMVTRPYAAACVAREHLAAQRGQRRGPRVHPVVDGQRDDRRGQAELDLGERERRLVGADRDVGGRDDADAAGADRAGHLGHHRLAAA